MTYTTPTQQQRQVDDRGPAPTEKLLDDRAILRICADIDTLERTRDAALQFDAILRALGLIPDERPPMNDPRHVLLRRGSHSSRENGMCAMELAAYLAGEEHSDSPRCVHPDLRDLIVALNDSYDDDRQRTDELLPLVLASIGTAGRVIDTDTAEKAYDAAVAAAQKVYDKARDAAMLAYEEAIAPVAKAHHRAMVLLPTMRDSEIIEKHNAYNEAVAPARQVFHDHITAALKVYDDAIATARRDCIAALLDECNRCREETESTITTTSDERARQ